MSDVLSAQRLIPSPPEPIFDLLADPAGHAEIDGGGTVKGARSGGRRLAVGDRFGMDMHLGVAYSTRNTVIELDENRRIAWQTTTSGPLGAPRPRRGAPPQLLPSPSAPRPCRSGPPARRRSRPARPPAVGGRDVPRPAVRRRHRSR